MREETLSVMLGAAMAVSLFSGCGGSSKPADVTTAALAATTAAPAADTTATPEADTEAPAVDTASSDGLIVVGYAQVGAESNWRTANTEFSKSTFTEENGYKLIFDDAQQKQENQIRAIRSFIQRDVGYIVVAPVVETGREAVLQKVQEAGIPVTLSDRMIDVDESLYGCWVGGNFIKEGEGAGMWLAKYPEDQGRGDEETNIVTFQETTGASAQVGRTKGFANTLAEYNNWKMLDKQIGEFAQAKGQEVMEPFLKSYDDIDVVVAENDSMAFGTTDMIKAAGKTCGPDGDIITFSFDAVKAAFDAMIAGDLNAASECNPFHGPRVDEVIKKPEKGETVEKIQYVDEVYFDTPMDLEAIKAERAY